MGLTLLVFTESYPYDVAHEVTFLEPQFPFLVEAFERVMVVPSRAGGQRHALPKGVEVDEGLLAAIGRTGPMKRLGQAVRWRWTRQELRHSHWVAVRHPKSFVRLVGTASRAALAAEWLRTYLAESGSNPSTCLVYSFWFDHSAIGAALSKSALEGLAVVARINGADFVKERHTPPYLPFRDLALDPLDRIFAVSEYGCGYLAREYALGAERCELARLGVKDPESGTQPRQEGRFTIASCSAIVPVKRVPLIAEAVGLVAARRPGTCFAWHHFGDGDEHRAVLERIDSFPANATATLHGHRSVAEIIGFYCRDSVGVFVNASESEGGTPVAAQEAASCSIPIIVTDVGGNPEILNGENGVLLGSNPTAEDIAWALIEVLDQEDHGKRMGVASREVYERRFRAEDNYRAFAARLASIGGGTR